MSNNYDDGYQAGLRGEQFTGSGVQSYAGYAAGQEARTKAQPQTQVDGVGFTALICAQLVCVIYPIAGTAAIGTGVVTWAITGWLGIGKPGIGAQIVLSLLLALAAFFPGFAVERRAARLKVYRVLRDCWRVGLVALIPLQMLMQTGRDVPNGGVIALAIVLVPIGYFILKRIDRAVGAAGMD
jgi:hypothetical protein